MDGRHIKVLGRGNGTALGSTAFVERFLEDLVSGLGMRQLGGVHLYEVVQEIEKMGVEPFEDEGGVTGVVVLSTSHCSIHTWPLRKLQPGREMFVLDVYSCRDFDPAVVEGLLMEMFDAHGLKITDLSQSLAYP